MTTGEYVTWAELLEWAKAHGAVNDKITSISIATNFKGEDEIRAVVNIKGWAVNEEGRPYSLFDGVGGNRLATWEVTNQLLKWLP